MDKVLVSKDNAIFILSKFMEKLKEKINNKDISIPYLEQLKKSGLLKIDGNGNMFLCNNGEYIKIDLTNINKDKSMIDTIYKLFKIQQHEGYQLSKENKLPYPLSSFSAQYYNDKIYCFGGDKLQDYVGIDDLNIYDMYTKTWSKGCNMITKKYSTVSVIYKNKAYVIGSWGSCTNIDEYDFESNTWSTKIVIPVSRYDLTMQVYNNKLYCMCGYSNNGVDIYDFESNTWSKGKTSSIERYALCSVLIDDKIYCIGGNNNGHAYLNTVEIYDISLNEWSICKPMNRIRGYTSAYFYNNKIYVIGGYGDIDSKNTIEIYNPKLDIWQIVKQDINNCSFGSVIHKNNIYIIGGKGSSLLDTLNILSLPYNRYDIKLPQELDTKFNIIKSNGKGDKVLSNNGSYISLNNNYNTMKQEDINNTLKQICKEI